MSVYSGDRILQRSLARTRRHKFSVVLLHADLDEFKSLNDTHGHNSGDVILRAIADRLRLGVREEDFVCRLGGDEFAVIVENVDSGAVAEDVAERILREVSKPFSLGNSTVPLAMSIGIGLFPADASMQADCSPNPVRTPIPAVAPPTPPR